jgi:hypothetical protein
MRRTSSLALAVSLAMAVAATMGLALDGLYRDNRLVSGGWRGNDAVTLFVAVPSLVAAARATRRASARGLLVCLGLLAYALYGYAFYLFGAAFNSAFLLYVAVLALATLGVIAGLTSAEMRAIVAGLEVRTAHRRVGVVVAAVASTLGLFWIAVSADYLTTGNVPAVVVANGHPTNVIGALDLWLVVTFGLWGGKWLIDGRPWGYVISAIWTVKGAFYMTALSAAAFTAFRTGALGDLTQLALWVPIGIACAMGASVLILDVPPSGGASDAARGAAPGSGR